MGKTAIEWTEHSANPIRFRDKTSGKTVNFCVKHSSGCANCYAERLGKRRRSPDFIARNLDKVEPFLDEAVLQEILRRRKPTTYFLCDMTDWMGEWVPDEFIDRTLAAIALSPQHTFQFLTKRADRLAAYFAGGPESPCALRICELMGEMCHRHQPERLGEMEAWLGKNYLLPMSNLWLGVSCENQATADARIPHLLNTPAAVRFLSCEPLLGRIDLDGWGDGAPASSWDNVPEAWDQFRWPEWVPAAQRKQIETFWGASYGRSPREWMRDHHIQHVPATGTRVTCVVENGTAVVNKMATAGETGRYLHSWNNIGRLITDDGRTIPAYGGIGSGWLSRWLTSSGDYKHKLNWVIVGGESGHDARPMLPRWAQGLRDQCTARGVSFFFKQFGTYGTDFSNTETGEPVFRQFQTFDEWVNKASSWVRGGICLDSEGNRLEIGRDFQSARDEGRFPVTIMHKVGKKAAGRVLDGREWNEMPTAEAVR